MINLNFNIKKNFSYSLLRPSSIILSADVFSFRFSFCQHSVLIWELIISILSLFLYSSSFGSTWEISFGVILSLLLFMIFFLICLILEAFSDSLLFYSFNSRAQNTAQFVFIVDPKDLFRSCACISSLVIDYRELVGIKI